MKLSKLNGLVDARGARGVFSRGTARYGPAGAPKPGNLQALARKRLKMQGVKERGSRSSRT